MVSSLARMGAVERYIVAPKVLMEHDYYRIFQRPTQFDIPREIQLEAQYSSIYICQLSLFITLYKYLRNNSV